MGPYFVHTKRLNARRERSATFRFKMEVHVNRFQLSPAARLFVSFALVIGILVAGQTHTFSPSAVQAQIGSEAVGSTSIGIGLSLPVSQGEVVGSLIDVRGVSLNGVQVDVVIPSRLQVFNSVIVSDSYMTINGVVIGGTLEKPQEGVVIGGTLQDNEPEDGGAPVSGGTEVEAQALIIDGGEGTVRLFGGELQGENISIVDGVVSGDNLRVVGTTVSAEGVSVSGVIAALPGY